MADLDHFKAVNDNEGHDAGDAALVHVTRVWSSCLRSADLLARYGGEEFTLILPETSLAEAGAIVERMRSLLEATPLVWEGRELRLTASFGVTAAGPETRSPDLLVRRADQALYRAKERGRNRVEVGDAG
jgi:diguanylate cyclase (GGDEF)-like protein